MVAPLIEYVKEESDATRYSYQRGFKQAKPHNIVSGYQRNVATVQIEVGDLSYCSQYTPTNIVSQTLAPGWSDDLLSRVYESFKSKVSDSAEMAVNFIEFRQATSMISDRSLQLFKFARALRRGDLVSAARELKLSAVPKRVSVKKSFANNYLEFHFGWSPLISDIYSAVGLLQSPVKDVWPSASKRQTSQVSYQDAYDGPAPGYDYLLLYRRAAYQEVVKMGASVAVNNPNLYLANQLGLVNPAAVFYETIPFSFVADWFVNVSQFLNNGTDLLGLTLDNAYTTHSMTGLWEFERYAIYAYHGDGTAYTHKTAVFSNMIRSPGIQKPGLFVRPFKIWGWRRAAAAVSLVIQQLVKK